MSSSKMLLFLVTALVYFVTPKSYGQQKDSLSSQLEVKWSNAKIYTLKMAELMPEEFYDFKPVPDVMSFKEQLLHIAQNIQWLSTSYLLSGKKPPKNDSAFTTKAAIIQRLTDAYNMGLLAHQSLSAEQLDQTVSFFAGPMTKRQILLLLHDHQTHHVGQIIVYLRLKGIKPPRYVGW
jgi:uncharacterized damage-inducible protein DinB